MTKKAKQYSSDRGTIKGELTTAQIMSKYGVHATQINKWKQEALQSMVVGFKSVAEILGACSQDG